jgi:hypothetical protein
VPGLAAVVPRCAAVLSVHSCAGGARHSVSPTGTLLLLHSCSGGTLPRYRTRGACVLLSDATFYGCVPAVVLRLLEVLPASTIFENGAGLLVALEVAGYPGPFYLPTGVFVAVGSDLPGARTP